MLFYWTDTPEPSDQHLRKSCTPELTPSDATTPDILHGNAAQQHCDQQLVVEDIPKRLPAHIRATVEISKLLQARLLILPSPAERPQNQVTMSILAAALR